MQVYFIGVDAKKRLVGQNIDSNNSGFDDDQALYIHVYHDHVAYRFEILKVSRAAATLASLHCCYTQGDSDVISMPAGFRRHLVGKTLINVFTVILLKIRFVGELVIVQTFS